MRCAYCGKKLNHGEEYLTIKDNFLIVKYFDSYSDNRFCSEECVCKALSVEREYVGEDNEEDKEDG